MITVIQKWWRFIQGILTRNTSAPIADTLKTSNSAKMDAVKKDSTVKILELSLKRKIWTDHSTVGDLFINGIWECFTLEDTVRKDPKIDGETAIPVGRYKVIIDKSERWGKMMPHILDVKGFNGIRIHSGNTDKDTRGCILVGKEHPRTDVIEKSDDAYDELLPKIEKGSSKGEVWITVA